MCNGIGLIVARVILPRKVVRVQCIFPSCETPYHAKQPHVAYRIIKLNPYNPETDGYQATPEQGDSIDNYIRESESNMQRNLEDETQVISSGSYQPE